MHTGPRFGLPPAGSEFDSWRQVQLPDAFPRLGAGPSEYGARSELKIWHGRAATYTEVLARGTLQKTEFKAKRIRDERRK